jgi:predicted DNA-binding WGR domain protein
MKGGGMFFVYDMLIGNPDCVPALEQNKKYNWMNKVRVVYKNGKISSKTGFYNGYGKVIFNGVKEAVSVSDYISDSDYAYDGYILLDKTYKMLKKHKLFVFLKDKNLFDLLTKFYKKNKKNMFYLSSGSLDIKNSIKEDEIWQLENPDKNLKNRERIEKIIDNFFIFSCKNKNETKNKLITKYYELKNDKSNKFWKISYRDGYYKITYGKIGSKGKTVEKDENIVKILKLIKSKEDKGYKQK